MNKRQTSNGLSAFCIVQMMFRKGVSSSDQEESLGRLSSQVQHFVDKLPRLSSIQLHTAIRFFLSSPMRFSAHRHRIRCYVNQQYYNFVAIRQGTLWWHDLNFLANEVVKCGMTPWVWSDKVWHTPMEEFTANMPKNIVQSSWYYGKDFGFADNGKANIPGVNAYLELAKAGYKQIPCGSNLHNAENYPETVRFCEKHLPESTIGYLMAPWRATNEKNEAQLLDGARIAGEAHDLIG
jgi:hypothetical protein